MKINFYWPTEVDVTSYFDSVRKDLENEEGEFNVVFAQKLNGYDGLDVALTLDPEKAPIILCCFYPYEIVKEEASRSKFYALMGRRRVGFGRIPFDVHTPQQWLKKYHEVLLDKRKDDAIAIEMNNVFSFEERMGQIEHCAAHSFGKKTDFEKELIAEAVLRAREIGVTGSDEEVELQIKNFKRKPINSVLAGRFFPGIFCDVEGTLIIDGKVNEELFFKLTELSLKKNITLWTGGDVEKTRELFTRPNYDINIFWNILPKTYFTGAEVEVAFDDEEYSVLFEKYGVKVREFIKV